MSGGSSAGCGAADALNAVGYAALANAAARIATAPLENVGSPSSSRGDAVTTTSRFEREVLQVLEADDVNSLKSVKHCHGEDALEEVIFKGLDGGRILHAAIRLGAKNCLKDVLLQCDAITGDLETPDDKGRTVVLVAVVCGRSEELKELLNTGANVNARDDSHYGVLHLLLESFREIAEESGTCKDQISKLECLMRVADVLLPPLSDSWIPPDLESHAAFLSRGDATPLNAACAMFEALDVEDKPQQSKTKGKVIEVCQRMISWGANYLDQQDELEDNGVVFTYMQKKFPRSLEVRVMDEVCRGNSGENLREELKNTAEARRIVSSRVGRHSVLFLAVKESNPEMVRMLLEFGADPQMDDNQCIKTAACDGSSCVFELLLEGMKSSIIQEDKDAIITILSEGETEGHEECLHLIQDL